MPTRQVRPVGGADATAPSMVSMKVLSVGTDTGLDALISAFYAKYPKYRVDKVTIQPGANLPDMLRLKLNEGAVDVLPLHVTGSLAVELARDNHLTPLDPYIKKSRTDTKPFGQMLEQMRMDGELFDLPYAIQPYVILYNQDMFQNSGVPLPREGWTWDQFREAARTLTRGSSGDTKVWGMGAYSPEPLVMAYLSQRTDTAGLIKDEKIYAETLQYFSTLIFTDKALPQAPRRGATSVTRIPFEQGRAAMSLDLLENLTWVTQMAKFKWNAAPLPVHDSETIRLPVSQRSFAIAATSPNPDAAWLFLEFACGPEGAKALAKAGVLPANRSAEVRKAWADRQPAPPPGTESLFDVQWQVVNRADPVQLKGIAALSQMISTALSGQKDWEMALQEFMAELAAIEAEGR